MPRKEYFKRIEAELSEVDALHAAKRAERIVEGYSDDASPKALIGGVKYSTFNSNDYLGLRGHAALREAEHEASKHYGSGPGAVRFISGTLAVHKELESDLARFHGREDAMLFSSAFAANLGLLSVIAKDKPGEKGVLVISDALNHRSIIDGIRLSGASTEQKAIFKHRDLADLERVLTENQGKWKRAVVVSDGVFSMLGVTCDLLALRTLIDKYDDAYPEGILLVIDDCHGVGALGDTGRGVEELAGVQADVLVGTLGKAFGSDGGYIVGPAHILNYLRENASTYIFSNPISPGTAGAGRAALALMDQPEGKKLRTQLKKHVEHFKMKAKELTLALAADSHHPIQPLLVGDTEKTRSLVRALYEKGYLVTPITFPVVPRGQDEIRVQISSLHDESEIDAFLACVSELASS